MCARIYWRVLLVSVGMIACLASVSQGNVVNYDNHPDLEKAKEYDLTLDSKRFVRPDGSIDHELYQSYVAKASRELAEKHYLAYLQDVNDSFQRAAVYARLGELFDGGAHPRVGTPVDRNKARTYFRKALEAEPERIGMATLQARGFLATDGNTPEERFASYTGYYQWLLSIDEKTLKEKFLPTRPARKVAPGAQEDETLRKYRKQMEAAMRSRPESGEGGFLGLIKGQIETTAHNLVEQAAGLMALDPAAHWRSRERAIRYLRLLVDRFPGTPVVGRAEAELARIAQNPADDLLVALGNGFDARWRRAFLPIASRVDANEPCILDLASGQTLLAPARLHTQETFTYLAQRGGDYLAWDDAFVVPQDAQLSVVHPTMPGALKVVKDQWSVRYELPPGVVDPYHLWLRTKRGQKYLLRVAGVKPEGVRLAYRGVTDGEFEAETGAAAQPRAKGQSGTPEGIR